MRSFGGVNNKDAGVPDLETFRLKLQEQMSIELSRSFALMSSDFW